MRCQPVHSWPWLEVGLAQVHLRVEVAEGLGDGLDALPVAAGVREELAGLVVLARPCRPSTNSVVSSTSCWPGP